MVDTMHHQSPYQAIILATGLGSRLYPLLTHNTQYLKSLIPVCNIPVIKYTIDLLHAHKFESCIIVCRQSQLHTLEQYVHTIQYNTDKSIDIDIQLIGVDDNIQGSADALRDISTHIYTDYIVIPCDTISTVSLYPLIDIHRLYNTAVACMFTDTTQTAQTNVKTKSKDKADDQADQIYVGLTHSAKQSTDLYKQILMYHTVADIDETFSVSKQLLRQHPSIRLYKQYTDTHIYLFSHWTIQLLCDKPVIQSLHNDFVPYLIRNQYKHTMKHWMNENITNRPPNTVPHNIYNTALQYTHSKLNDHNNQCNYKCYIYVAPTTSLCIQACNSIKSYVNANFELCNDTHYINQPYQSTSTHNHIKHYTDNAAITAKIDPKSYFGKNVIFENDSIIKRSIIGNNAKIGANCKLTNCIILHNAVIHDNCKLDDCIISYNAVIQNKCKLTNVKVGSDYVVAAETELKNESFSVDTSTAQL